MKKFMTPKIYKLCTMCLALTGIITIKHASLFFFWRAKISHQIGLLFKALSLNNESAFSYYSRKADIIFIFINFIFYHKIYFILFC